MGEQLEFINTAFELRDFLLKVLAKVNVSDFRLKFARLFLLFFNLLSQIFDYVRLMCSLCRIHHGLVQQSLDQEELSSELFL